MLIPAFRGEFGLKIRYHVPRVYAMGAGHVIEVEEGEEALYPLAAEWRVVARIREDSTPDASQMRGRQGRPKLDGTEQRFIPEPHIRQGVGMIDAVIAPRRRAYGTPKNWAHWPDLAESLAMEGVRVFAGGVADASDTRVACDAAWHYGRPLDATIEAIRSARLVIATDSGLAHLAVLCGAPLLIITYRGRVAPGPVISSYGRKARDDYWPVEMDEHYHAANHTGAPIMEIDGWEHPDRVLRRALEILG